MPPGSLGADQFLLFIVNADTTHIFIGVKDIEEALTYWNGCLAPSNSKRREEEEVRPIGPDTPTHTYTYTLTDEKGVTQGTVKFAPNTEGGFVADITTELPGLRHFKKVTFIHNDSWPTVSLSSIKADIHAGIDSSSHLGKYVSSYGNIIPIQKYAVGRVAYISNEPVDIDPSAADTRILVLANSDLGEFQWKNEISGGEDNFTLTNSMHSLQFCSTHNDDLYPAAKAAYNWDAGRPSGATNWFLPSMQQMTLMLPVAKTDGTGKMSSGHYWVANENLPVVYSANYYDFEEGSWHVAAKTDNLKVRACYAY